MLDTVTEGRTIPTAPNDEYLNTIMTNSANYLWDNDDDTHESEWLIIRNEMLDTKHFREKRKILMPECVHAVSDVQTAGRLDGATGFLFSQQHWNRDSVVNGYLGASSGDMLYSIARHYYADFQRHFNLKDIRFDYNYPSRTLFIEGRDTKTDIICLASLNISMTALCNHDRFFRYVCAKVMSSFTRVYGITDAKLLGGIGLSLTELKADAKEMLAEIKTELDAQKDVLDYWDEI